MLRMDTVCLSAHVCGSSHQNMCFLEQQRYLFCSTALSSAHTHTLPLMTKSSHASPTHSSQSQLSCPSLLRGNQLRISPDTYSPVSSLFLAHSPKDSHSHLRLVPSLLFHAFLLSQPFFLTLNLPLSVCLVAHFLKWYHNGKNLSGLQEAALLLFSFCL